LFSGDVFGGQEVKPQSSARFTVLEGRLSEHSVDGPFAHSHTPNEPAN